MSNSSKRDSRPVSSKRPLSAGVGILVVVMLVSAFILGRMTAPEKAGRLPGTGNTAPTPAQPAVEAPRPAARVAAATADNSSREAVEARVQASLRQLDGTPACEQREDERLRLILEWSATNPLAALEYARQNLGGDRKTQALSAVANAWARNDPAAAWGWALSQGPGEAHQLNTVLSEIGKNDAALATRFAADFAHQHPDAGVEICLSALQGMTYAGNFDAARQMIGEVQLGADDQATLLNFVAGQWARFEPEKTAQWVDALPQGAARDQALLSLGESWSEKNPPAAADFAAQLPAGPVRQTALRQAISKWILTEPGKAATWVNQFGSNPDFDQAVASVATMPNLEQQNVTLALNWANSISSETLRASTLGEILSNWSARDRAAALNYVQTAPGLSAGTRGQLLSQLNAGGSNP